MVELAAIPSAWLQRLVVRPSRPREDRDAADGQQGDATLPLGQAAIEFISLGVPVGEQRKRACAATRNLLALGTSAEDTVDLIWQGLERSPQEPGRPAWTRTEAEAIVADLERSEPKALRERPIPLTRIQIRAQVHSA